MTDANRAKHWCQQSRALMPIEQSIDANRAEPWRSLNVWSLIDEDNWPIVMNGYVDQSWVMNHVEDALKKASLYPRWTCMGMSPYTGILLHGHLALCPWMKPLAKWRSTESTKTWSQMKLHRSAWRRLNNYKMATHTQVEEVCVQEKCDKCVWFVIRWSLEICFYCRKHEVWWLSDLVV